jgi:hypothetical protein
LGWICGAQVYLRRRPAAEVAPRSVEAALVATLVHEVRACVCMLCVCVRERERERENERERERESE